jgi:hypothetical protein
MRELKITREEVEERINNKEPLKFIQWEGEYSGTRKSVAKVVCTRHNTEFLLRVTMLTGRTKDFCPACKRDKLGSNSRMPDSEITSKFAATGGFAEGTLFTRSARVTRGKRLHWNVFCPKCATDEYANAGLCTGWFEAEVQSLRDGNPPCRCSSTAINLSPAQWDYRVTKHLENRETGLSFVRIEKGRTWTRSKLIVSCKEHGTFDTKVFSVLFMGQGCPSCAKTGFDRNKASHIYVLKIEGIHKSFTGYGISNNLKQRMAHHRRTLNKLGLTITDSFALATSGDAAYLAECQLKEKFPVVNQGISGFMKEATLFENFPIAVEFVKSFSEVELSAVG